MSANDVPDKVKKAGFTISKSPNVDAPIINEYKLTLERGDYRRSREVGYYADRLCVTPKYLSEVCRKVSGYAARSAPWDASLVEGLLDQPLRHYRHRPPVARQEPLADRHRRHVRLHLAEPLHPLRAAEPRCPAQRIPLLMMQKPPRRRASKIIMWGNARAGWTIFSFFRLKRREFEEIVVPLQTQI